MKKILDLLLLGDNVSKNRWRRQERSRIRQEKKSIKNTIKHTLGLEIIDTKKKKEPYADSIHIVHVNENKQ